MTKERYIWNGEYFADIAADYQALTTDDRESIREGLNGA